MGSPTSGQSCWPSGAGTPLGGGHHPSPRTRHLGPPHLQGPRGWAPPVLPWDLLRGGGAGPEPGGRQCWTDNGFLVPLEPRAQSLVPAGELRALLAEAAWVSGQGCGRHPPRATCRASWSPEKPPEAFCSEASGPGRAGRVPRGVTGPSSTSGPGQFLCPATLGKDPPRAQHWAPPGPGCLSAAISGWWPDKGWLLSHRARALQAVGRAGRAALPLPGSEAALWHRRWHVHACAMPVTRGSGAQGTGTRVSLRRAGPPSKLRPAMRFGRSG